MIDDGTSAGGNRFNTEIWKSIKVNKFYKGKGRKHEYRIETQTVNPLNTIGSLSNYRYFITFRCDNTCYLNGVCACKFTGGGTVPENVVFHRRAILPAGTG